MELRNYPALGEQVIWQTLQCGLPVAIVPRPGFTKKLCYFVTDFGAIHTEFTLDGKSWSVPAGIAHYLEHKLFDLPGRDVTGEFAALGAIPNAFTGIFYFLEFGGIKIGIVHFFPNPKKLYCILITQPFFYE